MSLGPIKQKYGSKLSWADLYVYAGNIALENMGFPTYGFGFGRVDTWQSDEGVYWGSEQEMFPGNKSNTDRYNGSTNIYERADKLETPLADVAMGLIYVDPRGPNGIPDPKASALDIRETFGRMGMDDEETVALIAGGHAFGKTHGAVASSYIGVEPNSAGLEAQGFGWKNSFNTGTGNNTYTSGLEVIWSKTPTKWANGKFSALYRSNTTCDHSLTAPLTEFLTSLLKNNWTLVHSPAGAPQWEAVNANASYPDPFIPGKFRKPTMLTSDLGLRYDPTYHNISQTFLHDFDYFTEKFGLAWCTSSPITRRFLREGLLINWPIDKLLHRDMGPISRYLGPEVPKKAPLIWQDPLPTVNYSTIDSGDASQLKQEILSAPGLNVSNLVTTAWGSASSFRISDKRGGANGGRIALNPQRTFAANNPERLESVLQAVSGFP